MNVLLTVHNAVYNTAQSSLKFTNLSRSFHDQYLYFQGPIDALYSRSLQTLAMPCCTEWSENELKLTNMNHEFCARLKHIRSVKDFATIQSLWNSHYCAICTCTVSHILQIPKLSTANDNTFSWLFILRDTPGTSQIRGLLSTIRDAREPGQELREWKCVIFFYKPNTICTRCCMELNEL